MSTANPPPPAALDRADARILRVLQADGRISNLELAEVVHLSPTAVLERVKRLTRDGVILGYEARLNPDKLGAGLLVFIEVVLDCTTHDAMNLFKAAVQVRPRSRMPSGRGRVRPPDQDPRRRHAGLPRVRRLGDLGPARRARDAHLRGDGRGEEHDDAAALTASSGIIAG